MRKLWSILTPWEKMIVAFLGVALIITGTQISFAFIEANSLVTPKEGGIYTEGMVGKLSAINPLYAPWGSISYDIVRLVFSGLARYDPATKEVVPDLADVSVSKDKKEYTFSLKKGAVWHDGTPVTSKDVLFTYNDIIKNPEFNGAILGYVDLSGVTISASDDQTVKFTLNQPDSFFLVKTMTGILPQHILGAVPFKNLPQSDFNQFPIGSGRYQIVSITPVEGYTEVSLEAYPQYYGEAPHIKTLLLDIFSDFPSLLKKQGTLSAIRNVPSEFIPGVLNKGKLVIQRYNLPQYVAAFMNTESPVLKERKVRLALQLGTDKKSLIEALHETQIIDTPLLEMDQGNWIHQYSPKRANGALFEAGWQIPNKEVAVKAQEIKITPKITLTEPPSATTPVTFISQPNGGKDFETTDSKVVIGGTNPGGTQKIIVNDYELRKFKPDQESWSYVASAEFQSLVLGANIYEVFAVDKKGDKKKIDSIKITVASPEVAPKKEEVVAPTDAEKTATLPIRQNKTGKPLQLNLITSQTPAAYAEVAEILKNQWWKIGVDVKVEVLDSETFQNRVSARQYDLLIFGQNLGYNLDAYPYWHSSQAKQGGYNLSQFKNFIVDSLLEKARFEYDKQSRQETLRQIQTILSEEAPAVFLYSPTHSFALSAKVQNVTLTNWATTSDRFAEIHTWYANLDRTLKPGTNLFTFLQWIIKQF
ncbi:hypothetical protein HZA43_05465 [Candidatus Peregrinibacteria bacterium]|nr:hypothetical protein [Candidatus Peregrinibacteria bacterium]